MYKIKISKICECIKESDLKTNFEFDSNEESMNYALKLKNSMNEDFCSKHKFEIIKIFDDYIISTVQRKEKSLKCCHTGCCF